MLTNSDITKLKHIFVTKDEFQDHFDVLEGKFNQVMKMLDSVMGELKAIREEQTIMFHTLVDHSDKIENYESRLVYLEGK